MIEAKMAEQKQEQQKEDFEEIIRFMGRDINGNKSIIEGIKRVKGVSHSMANAILYKSKFDPNTKAGLLKEKDIEELENMIKNPQKYGLPEWLYNRRKDRDSGENIHLVEADREFAQKFDIRWMRKLRSYKGIRHGFGLPVRGQKTKTSFRTGSKIGVSRKKVAQKKKGGEK